MKKLLLLMGFCCSMTLASAQAQRPLLDNQGNTIGYIETGTVFNKENVKIGQFKWENNALTIYGKSNKIVGYVVNGDSEVQDADHKTIGYMKLNRETYITTVEDANHKVLGTVNGVDYKIRNSSNTVIGQSKTEPVWAGVYYFLLKF